MNGIDAVLLATMNDFRAQEANSHAYASMGGYGPLTEYRKDAMTDGSSRLMGIRYSLSFILKFVAIPTG